MNDSTICGSVWDSYPEECASKPSTSTVAIVPPPEAGPSETGTPESKDPISSTTAPAPVLSSDPKEDQFEDLPEGNDVIPAKFVIDKKMAMIGLGALALVLVGRSSE